MKKIYQKQYEDVFTSDRSSRSLNPAKLSFGNLDVDTYSRYFNNALSSGMLSLYNTFIQLIWLGRMFEYDTRRIKYRRKGFIQDKALSRFSRAYTGMDMRIFTRDFAFGKIESYVDEMFPSFDDGNPFENPGSYKLPYKRIGIDYMTVVYQMDERMELLELADKKEMSYNEFLDFVINQVYSTNEDVGRNKYDFVMSKICPPYVRNNDIK